MIILSLLCRVLVPAGASTVPADLALAAATALALTGVVGSRLFGRREVRGAENADEQDDADRTTGAARRS